MTTTSGPTTQRWWDSPFRLLQTNLREDDVLLDAEASVDQLVDLGYDTWLCNAGGISYFYPVHEPYQRAAPRLAQRASGDMVGDVVRAAHARDVRVLSRFDFSRLPADVVAEHPDWAFLDQDGRWYTEDGLTAICPRSDYHEVLAPRILRDFVERYPVDGVFFNWLQYPEVAYSGRYKGVCQCDRCRAAFADAHPGVPHPTALGEPGYDRWLDVAQQRLTELAERYSRVVNEVRPGTPLMLADVRMDIAFLEINSSLGGHDSDRWWVHTPGEMASLHRTSDPRVPALVHASVNMGLPYRQIAEEPTQFRRYVAQALSRGALPSSVVVGTVDVGRFPCLPAASDLLGLLRERTDLYADYRSASTVALLRPRGGTAMSAMQHTVDHAEYRGVYTALQEAHVPFDVLGLQYQEQLVHDDVVARYDVVVVPGTAGIDEAFARALDDFVRGGGSLVVTGDGFRDGRPVLESAPAAALVERLSGIAELGGRYVGPSDDRVDVPLHPVIGHFDRVETQGGVTSGVLALSTQTPFGPPEITGGNTTSGGDPALLHGTFGAGRTSQLPWAVGATVHRSGLTALGDLVAREVEVLRPRPEIVGVDLPRGVELTVGVSRGRVVLHLVNHSGGRGDRVREPIPITGSVTLTGAWAALAAQGVRALVADRRVVPLEVTDGLRVPVTVDDVLEVVEIG
ncbi:hypothetical protein [Isoptericola sp. AK164]|uniref:hypothetical protein n=1 Tax=Isoptericola sp. AK164 TaxID=3024246 RepID=UPI0024182654|nr:hypothetical protein [Isoptericola sp. AK164]